MKRTKIPPNGAETCLALVSSAHQAVCICNSQEIARWAGRTNQPTFDPMGDGNRGHVSVAVGYRV